MCGYHLAAFVIVAAGTRARGLNMLKNACRWDLSGGFMLCWRRYAPLDPDLMREACASNAGICQISYEQVDLERINLLARAAPAHGHPGRYVSAQAGPFSPNCAT
jgi:hypothetical protein